MAARPVSGVVVLDKPAGVSSAKALAPVKQACGRRVKVGHAGTLDPFATGVLLALVGDATRLSDLAMALPKTYRATVRFGWQTDTLDTEGAVVAEADPGPVPDLAGSLRAFHGAIEQVPPAYSALKVDGRRAYKLARAGETPELAARTVTVHAAGILAVRWPRVEVELTTGTGFYVRSFARDWGAAHGLPASLDALRRTAIGPFRADTADPGLVRPALEIVRAAGWPELPIAEARRFVTGQRVRVDAAPGRYAVLHDALLLGLGEVDGGALIPRTVLAAARRAICEG